MNESFGNVVFVYDMFGFIYGVFGGGWVIYIGFVYCIWFR